MQISQCRAARAILGITQQDLADASNVNKRTIMDFESGKRTPVPATITTLRLALESAGAVFIPENGGGAGVRLRDPGGAE
ncbi:MAG: transcriptional regulator with XRE-family HTH domain [Sulfitobacter sp.]|jgi:transcriptional regulator with XRE-family HTH domain